MLLVRGDDNIEPPTQSGFQAASFLLEGERSDMDGGAGGAEFGGGSGLEGRNTSWFKPNIHEPHLLLTQLSGIHALLFFNLI